MIHLVVALPAEAEPLVEHLGLQRAAEASDLRLFVSASARLLVCGVGRTAAADGVRVLRARTGEEDPVWVNVGVAAHRSLAIGELVAATRIVDVARRKSWQLGSHERWELPQATVATVDRPQLDLLDDRLYEMEAAGFTEAVLEGATERRIACFKVVSDRGSDSMNGLSRQKVTHLIRRNVVRLTEILSAAERDGHI